MSKKIIALPGDGIGAEIMDSALTILEEIMVQDNLEFDIERFAFGGAGIDQKGDPLPEETLEACKKADAILLGAIGGPKWDNAPKRPEQGLLALRKALGLFANIRPISVPDAVVHLSPLKEENVRGVDFVVVRELTGGIYFGEKQLGDTEASDLCTYSKAEIQRIIRKAFEIARTRNKKVTSVDKANVLSTSKLWRHTAEEVAAEFPDCTLEHQLVDSAAMVMIQRPKQFDVIVTENLFGDILSDEASVIPGSLGMMPSASHSETGPSLYEPIHGSAPDIANQNKANPMSMILSAAMMLRQSFGLERSAQKIEAACDRVMNQGILTTDLGGKATTTEFTEAVLTELRGA
ncbi:3-isopropylmalate dehydrogenase [Enterococcus sp. DIV0242_7C1]|uniref:3-isopropylmalate dehydrogenase n=1 Tax=Candidatus Enterococcus dunnyi TaxID=1834192 RepID=A0A200JE73_9ENTE|nr:MULTISPECIES: 3-isopropylmalate dehydrogenase [unclassified Enterococcus]MBO0469712.1 3-isopropylmalate dehydrogenase [Enterococcus sp. DIV0242_7C1]OUZ35000.1 3-isopropylmalate dehydrogenase [Enterococcus sp. 9D6_DIV0238]